MEYYYFILIKYTLLLNMVFQYLTNLILLTHRLLIPVFSINLMTGPDGAVGAE